MRSRTHKYYGSADGERQAAMRALTSRRGGVMLTTYGMVQHNAELLSRGLGRVSDGKALGACCERCAFAAVTGMHRNG
jgi:hypothetical protein